MSALQLQEPRIGNICMLSYILIFSVLTTTVYPICLLKFNKSSLLMYRLSSALDLF
jgi:hypothetical protein